MLIKGISKNLRLWWFSRKANLMSIKANWMPTRYFYRNIEANLMSTKAN